MLLPVLVKTGHGLAGFPECGVLGRRESHLQRILPGDHQDQPPETEDDIEEGNQQTPRQRSSHATRQQQPELLEGPEKRGDSQAADKNQHGQPCNNRGHDRMPAEAIQQKGHQEHNRRLNTGFRRRCHRSGLNGRAPQRLPRPCVHNRVWCTFAHRCLFLRKQNHCVRPEEKGQTEPTTPIRQKGSIGRDARRSFSHSVWPVWAVRSPRTRLPPDFSESRSRG